MTSSKIFFYFCLSFIIGIFIGSVFFIPPNILGIVLFLVAVLGLLTPLFIRKKIILIIFACLAILLLAIWHYQVVDFKVKNNNLKRYNDGQVVLLGKVLTEPDIRENSVQLTVNAEKIILDDEEITTSGKFLVKTNKYPEYNYADELIISGQLKTPGVFEDFNYEEYLAKKGILSLMDWPKIEIIQKENYSNWRELLYAKILKFKNKIRENIDQNFPYPASSLLGAMLLGDQSAMPQTLKDKLNITGLRHITAISGMHVAILCSILMSLFLGLGFWRGQAFYLTLIFIFFFVLMVGFRPSVVRAGIMAATVLLAQKVGRLSASSRVLVITAAVMLVLNPMLLRWDVSFQLSFLAILGIIFLTQPLENLLKFIPKEKFVNARRILATTFSAQIFTLPILIYNFGRISLISPLTNFLILPVIYWLMLFGFLFGLLSVVWWGFGWIILWPCWFLISYAMKIIDIFSQPWAQKTIENVHWLWLIISYLILGYLAWWLNKREKLKFLNY